MNTINCQKHYFVSLYKSSKAFLDKVKSGELCDYVFMTCNLCKYDGEYPFDMFITCKKCNKDFCESCHKVSVFSMCDCDGSDDIISYQCETCRFLYCDKCKIKKGDEFCTHYPSCQKYYIDTRNNN